MQIDWTAISAIATAVAAIAAAIAAYLSFSSLSETRRIAAEQRANDYTKRYLELTIEFPDLSTEGSVKQKQEQRYSWFVSFVLMMVREVLSAYPGDIKRRNMMLQQLSYIDSAELKAWTEDDQLSVFGSDVERLVDEALGRKATA